MKSFFQSLPGYSNNQIGYFENIFLQNQSYVESRAQISSGVLQVLDVFTDKVLLSTYVTDTGDSTGEYIQFGRLSLRFRDDNAGWGYGDHIIFLTTETVTPFAFKPVVTENAWYPFHTEKTAWSIDGVIPAINIDGTDYTLYTDTLSWTTFTKITIDQDTFCVVTLQGIEPVNPDRVADGVLEVNTILTITHQQFIQELTFKVTAQIIYPIGYTPMLSVDGNAMKYQLLQNGKKFIFNNVDSTQHYNNNIYEFGYNSDENYGCAVIINQADGVVWTTGQLCNRYLINSQSATKRKLYFEILRANTPALNSIYKNTSKYIWGQSNNFQTIYNSAEIENI